MDKFEKGDKQQRENFIKNIGLKLDCACTHVTDLVEIFQKLKANSKLTYEQKKAAS
jgi:hypothetical protein